MLTLDPSDIGQIRMMLQSAAHGIQMKTVMLISKITKL